MKVTDSTAFVMADNPNMMTLTGTNTWILRHRDSSTSVVVDPGPLIEQHLAAVLEIAGDVELTLVTHHHEDHTEAVERFRELTNAPTRAFAAEHTYDAEVLSDGELINAAGLQLKIVATPGHTADSMCIVVLDDRAILTGDTVLGKGTSIIAYPDGHLGSYLDSLQSLRDIVARENIEWLLPAHGPVINEPAAVLDYYISHRLERLDQVKSALDAGATNAREVVERVYVDVDQSLWPAAERSVKAQLEYLGVSTD